MIFYYALYMVGMHPSDPFAALKTFVSFIILNI